MRLLLVLDSSGSVVEVEGLVEFTWWPGISLFNLEEEEAIGKSTRKEEEFAEYYYYYYSAELESSDCEGRFGKNGGGGGAFRGTRGFACTDNLTR